MAKIIALFCLTLFSLFAKNADEIFELIDESTWVVFDLDSELLVSTEIVQKMQASAGAVFGLTARAAPLTASTLKDLAYIGIHFTFSAPFCPSLEIKGPTHWEGGVLFISDFNSKAEVFLKWLELAKFRPSKIVIIDSGNMDQIQMGKEVLEIKIPDTSFYYLKALGP